MIIEVLIAYFVCSFVFLMSFFTFSILLCLLFVCSYKNSTFFKLLLIVDFTSCIQSHPSLCPLTSILCTGNPSKHFQSKTK